MIDKDPALAATVRLYTDHLALLTNSFVCDINRLWPAVDKKATIRLLEEQSKLFDKASNVEVLEVRQFA